MSHKTKHSNPKQACSPFHRLYFFLVSTRNPRIRVMLLQPCQSILTKSYKVNQNFIWNFFRNCNPGDRFGQKPKLCSEGERKRQFIKIENGEGAFKSKSHKSFERAIIGTGKQTYTRVYQLIAYVYCQVKKFFLVQSSVMQSQFGDLCQDVAL